MLRLDHDLEPALGPSVDRFTRLSDVRFCVLDLETTGTSDEHDEIVEVGAVLVQGGQHLGSLQTMVRHPLAPFDDTRPAIGAVLASLLEFARGAVVVGHNIQFDLRFLNAALLRDGRQVALSPAAAIDTMHLSRRLLRDDAGDCRLGTLAERFAFHHRPTHRALADAQATVELLHLVIERATHYGALDLDDLQRLPQLFAHRERERLALTAHLPRAPGVACLRDRHGGALHVVCADDLRDAVRSLFGPAPAVPSSVLRQLHHLDVVASPHRVVTDLATVRWSAQVPRPARDAPAYVRVVAARPGQRAGLTSAPDARHIVAGPFDRTTASRMVAALQLFGAADATSDATAHAFASIAHAVHLHEQLLAGRAVTGEVAVDDATVTIVGGRVLDVTIAGESWADRLPVAPPPDAGWPTAASAAEARLVAGWLRPAPYEMRVA